MRSHGITWLTRWLPLACILQLTCLAAVSETVGPNINLTKAAGNQYEPAVAINPANPGEIFIAARNELGGLYVASSVDSGAAWTTRWIATGAIGAGLLPRAYGNASVAWDSFGNLFLTYLVQSSTHSPATYVALTMSTDGGATWHNPNGAGTALLLPTGGPLYIGDQPTVTVGPGSAGYPGSVWVTYWSFGGIWASGAGVSGLGAVSPVLSMVLPGQPAAVNFGDIAVGPNGEVMVTYGPNSGNSGGLYVQLKPDGLGPAPFGGAILVRSVNVGGFTSIPAQPNWGIDPEVGLAWDRTNGLHRGRLYVVYTDAPTVLSVDTNIFVIYSDNQGATWSTPVRVNDDIGTNSQFLPRISLDQSTGAVAVTWYNLRPTQSSRTRMHRLALIVESRASGISPWRPHG